VRILGGVLAALIVLVQVPLWLGKGGWLRVWEVDRQLDTQRSRNVELQARNRSLEAEVLDLKQGVDALEERARYELGMIKSDEVFFQIVEKGRAPAPIAPQPAPGR
jgi:cell division protein FtsB